MNIIILALGSGERYQAQIIVDERGVVQLSTGDMFVLQLLPEQSWA